MTVVDYREGNPRQSPARQRHQMITIITRIQNEGLNNIYIKQDTPFTYLQVFFKYV